MDVVVFNRRFFFCWKMDVVVINGSLTSLTQSHEERVWSPPKPGMQVVSSLRVFFLSWPWSFHKDRLLHNILYKRGIEVDFFWSRWTRERLIIQRNLPKLCSLFSSDKPQYPVTWTLKGVEMEMTFSFFNVCTEINFSFVLNVASPRRR